MVLNFFFVQNIFDVHPDAGLVPFKHMIIENWKSYVLLAAMEM